MIRRKASLQLERQLAHKLGVKCGKTSENLNWITQNKKLNRLQKNSGSHGHQNKMADWCLESYSVAKCLCIRDGKWTWKDENVRQNIAQNRFFILNYKNMFFFFFFMLIIYYLLLYCHCLNVVPLEMGDFFRCCIDFL